MSKKEGVRLPNPFLTELAQIQHKKATELVKRLKEYEEKRGGPRRLPHRTPEQVRAAQRRVRLWYELKGVFLFDHPEWVNPHTEDTDDHFRWEMRNGEAIHNAFSAWLEDRE